MSFILLSAATLIATSAGAPTPTAAVTVRSIAPHEPAIAPALATALVVLMVYLMGGHKVPELSPLATADSGPETGAFAQMVSRELFGSVDEYTDNRFILSIPSFHNPFFPLVFHMQYILVSSTIVAFGAAAVPPVGSVAPHGASSDPAAAKLRAIADALATPEFNTYDPLGEALGETVLSAKFKLLVSLLGGHGVADLSPFGATEWTEDVDRFARETSQRIFGHLTDACTQLNPDGTAVAVPACKSVLAAASRNKIHRAMFVKYILAHHASPDHLLTAIIGGAPLSAWSGLRRVARVSLPVVVEWLGDEPKMDNLAHTLTQPCLKMASSEASLRVALLAASRLRKEDEPMTSPDSMTATAAEAVKLFTPALWEIVCKLDPEFALLSYGKSSSIGSMFFEVILLGGRGQSQYGLNVFAAGGAKTDKELQQLNMAAERIYNEGLNHMVSDCISRSTPSCLDLMGAVQVSDGMKGIFIKHAVSWLTPAMANALLAKVSLAGGPDVTQEKLDLLKRPAIGAVVRQLMGGDIKGQSIVVKAVPTGGQTP